MAVAAKIKEALSTQSLIRGMFEEGLELKKKFGAGAVYDFSIGNPDLEPPPAFKKVLRELAGAGEPGAHGYMPNAGFPQVREALAGKVSREQNVNPGADGIVMSAGAAGALNVVFKSILNPGDEVIVSKPYFMEYRSYIENHGGKIIEVDAGEDFSLNTDGIGDSLTEKTAAVLINSPNNPAGVVYSRESIAALAEILSGHGKKGAGGRAVYLVSDESYREIIFEGEVPPVLPAYKNSIIVSSYSKSLSLAGERIGFIAVSPEADCREELTAALIYSTRILGFVNAPALMQRCVARLTGERVDIAVYKRRRDEFSGVLDRVGIEYIKPQGAFYIFARVPPRGKSGARKTGDDIEFSGCLKKHLILAVPGSAFGRPFWMRFAFCVNEGIIKASEPAFVKAMAEWTS